MGEHALQLYSLATPNGVKATIMLEELLALGIEEAEYDAWLIDIGEGDQFGSGFVAVNPNSKIPALMDHSTDPPTRVFESGSILLYLAQRFGAFLPEDPRARTETMSWLFWQMGAAPYLGGGFGHFYSYAPTKRGLLGLADEPTLVAHQQVLHELLRDGRAALDHPARAQVGPRRPHDADRIDASVLPEALVLRGDERVDEVLGERAQRDPEPALHVEDVDLITVRVQDAARLGRLVVHDELHVRQITQDRALEPDGPPCQHEAPQEDAPRDDPTDDRQGPAEAAASVGGGLGHRAGGPRVRAGRP